MTTPNIPRLEHLRDLLRADAANPKGAKFDLGSWVGRGIDPETGAELDEGNNQYPLVDGKPTVTPTMSCDTFACALGLAALDPKFQEQGLHFEVLPMGGNTTAWMVPQFAGQREFYAGAAFFGLSVGDSHYLFDPDCYDGTPKEAEGERFVAQRIDDLIRGVRDMDYHPDRETSDDDEDED